MQMPIRFVEGVIGRRNALDSGELFRLEYGLHRSGRRFDIWTF